MSLEQTLQTNDPAAFVAAVRSDATLAQFANFDQAIKKAEASGDADLMTFAKNAEKAALFSAEAEKLELDDKGFDLKSLMGKLGDVITALKGGDIKGAISTLSEAFNFNATGEKVAQLEQSAQVSADAATEALKNSTHGDAAIIRSAHGTDVVDKTVADIDGIKPG